MRVGIISLAHESNTFAPSPTTLDDFRRERLCVGPDVCKNCSWGNHEIGGMVDGLKSEGIEAIPLFVASALPGKAISADDGQFLVDSLLSVLAGALPLDGLLLAPHGAGVCEKWPDLDGHWLSEVRRLAGPNMPIIATIDPHANLSQAMAVAVNALIAYQTNPHLDRRERGLEAASLMARTLRGEIRPVMSVRLTPVVINIERQLTAEPPLADFEDLARQIAGRSGMLSSSVVMGFPYADVPEMGSSVIAVANGNADLAEQAADELAAHLLKNREKFVGQLINPEDAIKQAASLPGPVCLLDMGDNVGGGSPADGTVLAHLLNRPGVGRSFVTIYDPVAATAARNAGVGGSLRVSAGGKSGQLYGPPLEDEVTVRFIGDGRFRDPRPRHSAMVDYDIGPLAVVKTQHGLTMMLTTRRVFPVSLVQLTSANLDPLSFRYIVAKGVHAPVAAYAEACPSRVRVNTPGVTSADLSHFSYRNRRRPLFPFEQI